MFDLDPRLKSLPPSFLWGGSTSAFQVEGATTEGGRGESIWDRRCKVKGVVTDGSNADSAADHYHRYPEDILMMKNLGIKAYRFSISWPRLLPKGKGMLNQTGIDFYNKLIDHCLEADIEPWLTLYHWDLPQALDDLGGWTNRDSVGWFEDYSLIIAKKFGDRVKKFATFNEFSVFTLFGYAIDWAAPGVTDKVSHLKAIHHVNLAHGIGVEVLRDHVKEASIGAIHNCQQVFPVSESLEDKQAAILLDEHWNKAFPDPQLLGHYPPHLAELISPYVKAGDMAKICRPVDWFGLNHYGPIHVKKDLDPQSVWGFAWADTPAGSPDYGVGWPVFPEYFREMLLYLTQRYQLPIYVTENGCGGSHDEVDEQGNIHDHHRVTFLRLFISAMIDAIEKGAKVSGYFVWTLLDCFEWGSGYTTRFGLIHVDYTTQERRFKDSAYWYQALLKEVSR
jgi:beta-glucosidase